jgi:hypothetical protein
MSDVSDDLNVKVLLSSGDAVSRHGVIDCDMLYAHQLLRNEKKHLLNTLYSIAPCIVNHVMMVGCVWKFAVNASVLHRAERTSLPCNCSVCVRRCALSPSAVLLLRYQGAGVVLPSPRRCPQSYRCLNVPVPATPKTLLPVHWLGGPHLLV